MFGEVRRFVQSYVKPGMKMVFATLENVLQRHSTVRSIFVVYDLYFLEKHSIGEPFYSIQN